MYVKKMRLAISILVLLTTLAPAVRSEPLNIIIVTGNAGSERGYTQFLQDAYRGNVNVQIDPGRYDENLSAGKKLELESADLIIVSRDTDCKDYNADADFWNKLNVPILNHNIKLARRAMELGMHLKADGSGLMTDAGGIIAVHSEEEIFQYLKLDYRSPEERD